MASEGETITISHETRMKLSRLRKRGQSYDSLISTMADQVLILSESEEEWDVDKIENDVNYPALKSGACNSGVTTDIAI